MADEDCCILFDNQAKTYRIVPVSDSKFVDLNRFRIMGYARGKAFCTCFAPRSDIFEASDDGIMTPAPEPRIPRPPNAWIIYRSHKSKEIRKKVPHVTAGYISIEAQKLHKAMYPNYKYNANAKKNQG
uniref:MAT1-1-3 n=1 Tax=Leptographium procerum TaxID=100367 RepID=S5TCK4_9PEZI|nr:MAT1-1-3 [Leptographium procerum]